MARAHAANACAQSNSIKGLAQSIAKPDYNRLLIAEPALRRAVPTLIIAFLITICLGAFVQVLDQSRQKRKASERDLGALSDYLAERIDRLASIRQDRFTNIERMQFLLADLIPAWGIAAGRHVIVAGADRRILARVADRVRPRSDRRHSRHHQLRAIAGGAEPAGHGERHHPAERQSRAGDDDADQGVARPDHRAAGKCRAGLGFGFRAVGDAVGDDGLRRADPRLRLPLAVHPRPRGRPDQRRRARPHRHRAQSRPLRLVGLGPVARSYFLVAVDVHHARAGRARRPLDLRRGQRAGEIRRHRSVRDRRAVDRRRDRSYRPDLPYAAHRRALDLAARPLRAEPQRAKAASI